MAFFPNQTQKNPPRTVAKDEMVARVTKRFRARPNTPPKWKYVVQAIIKDLREEIEACIMSGNEQFFWGHLGTFYVKEWYGYLPHLEKKAYAYKLAFRPTKNFQKRFRKHYQRDRDGKLKEH